MTYHLHCRGGQVAKSTKARAGVMPMAPMGQAGVESGRVHRSLAVDFPKASLTHTARHCKTAKVFKGPFSSIERETRLRMEAELG